MVTLMNEAQSTSDTGTEQSTETISIGISSCVIGEKVRFDGGHKRNHFISEEFGRYVEFVPLCPEVGIGLGVPRETIRLVGEAEHYGATGKPNDNKAEDSKLGIPDVTEPLREFGRAQLPKLSHISGYIFCAKSPSCGMERVPVYRENGNALGKIGTGIYAQEILKGLPLVPCEENGRLQDPVLRENFVMRVFAYKDWQNMVSTGLSNASLQGFQRRHKYLLMAHSQAAYKKLGQVVANAHEDLESAAQAYIAGFMQALSKPATRKNHCNTLMHIQGYFKNQLTSEEKQELSSCIQHYHEGIEPLMVPLAMLRLFTSKYPNEYVREQSYLRPFPADLKLRYAL